MLSKLRPRFPSLALAAVLVLVLGPAAQAKSPPNGKYSCKNAYGSGYLEIETKTTYNLDGEKEGSYTTERKRIEFKTGGLWLYYAKWRKIENRSGDVRYLIRIRRDDRASTTPENKKLMTCHSSWT